MALPACIERALTSSGVNPICGMTIVVAAWSPVAISALRIVDHLSPLKTAAICVSGVALCCRKCAPRRRMAATAHARGCPIAPFPIISPLTPFLCVVKRRLMNVVATQMEGEALVDWVGWVTTKNWMS